VSECASGVGKQIVKQEGEERRLGLFGTMLFRGEWQGSAGPLVFNCCLPDPPEDSNSPAQERTNSRPPLSTLETLLMDINPEFGACCSVLERMWPLHFIEFF
jgi:hypothetical protein